MKAAWVLAMAVGVVMADGNLGYHYQVPYTSYGLPSYQLSGSSNQFNSAYASSNSGNFYKGYPSFNSAYNTGNVYSGSAYNSDQSGLSSGLSGDLSSSLSSGLGGIDTSYYLNSGTSELGSIGQPIYQYTDSSNLGGYQSQSQSQSSEYKTSALEKYKNYYQVREQPAEVFKHFYVHSAPEEPETPKPRTSIVLPPPQKHYKIIFVKTPSESRAPQVVPVPQVQNEEKTIVYVLVKKPEETQDVIVPKVEQKPPSKPEVFFIKYKNKEDPQAVIDNIVKDYNKGQSVPLVNSAVGDGTVYDNSGLSSSSGLSGNFGSAGLSGAFENSDLSNSYVSSEFGSNLANSGFSSDFDNSGLSGAFGSSGFQSPVPSPATASLLSSQAFGITPSPASETLSVASADNSAGDSQLVNIASSSTPISSTASTIGYEDINSISTSQGVPHETYGPPKFRVD